MLKRLILTLLFLIFAAEANAGEVRILAAASLREALDEICARYEQEHREVRFVRNYGASGTLAKQVENGAPVDIFISANQEWLDYLKGKGRLDAGSVGTFAFNALVFVGRGDVKAAGMMDIPTLSRIAIGSPKSVPAGEYALESLRKAGIAGLMEKKLVMARDVRDALMYAERGDVDGAFVYRTDVLHMKRAKLLFAVPPDLYKRISYPMALTLAGAKNGEAADFYRSLRSRETRALLQKQGFEVK